MVTKGENKMVLFLILQKSLFSFNKKYLAKCFKNTLSLNMDTWTDHSVSTVVFKFVVSGGCNFKQDLAEFTTLPLLESTQCFGRSKLLPLLG